MFHDERNDAYFFFMELLCYKNTKNTSDLNIVMSEISGVVRCMCDADWQVPGVLAYLRADFQQFLAGHLRKLI